MKRILVLSVLNAALLLSVNGIAQTNPGEGATRIYKFADLGIKAGVNMQQIVAYPFASTYNQGFVAGLYYEKRHNRVALRIEANASTSQFTTDLAASKKYKLSSDAATDTVSKGIFDVMYVNVPVMAVFKLGRHGNFMMGAQYSRLISCKDNNGAFTKMWKTEKILKDDYFSAMFGLEFEMVKRLRLGVTYSQGFTDINANKYPGIVGPWMTGSAQAYLTYKIRRWY